MEGRNISCLGSFLFSQRLVHVYLSAEHLAPTPTLSFCNSLPFHEKEMWPQHFRENWRDGGPGGCTMQDVSTRTIRPPKLPRAVVLNTFWIGWAADFNIWAIFIRVISIRAQVNWYYEESRQETEGENVIVTVRKLLWPYHKKKSPALRSETSSDKAVSTLTTSL